MWQYLFSPKFVSAILKAYVFSLRPDSQLILTIQTSCIEFDNVFKQLWQNIAEHVHWFS